MNFLIELEGSENKNESKKLKPKFSQTLNNSKKMKFYLVLLFLTIHQKAEAVVVNDNVTIQTDWASFKIQQSKNYSSNDSETERFWTKSLQYRQFLEI